MITSTHFKRVVWFPSGSRCEDMDLSEGWYHWDEVGLLGGGPFLTEALAAQGLQDYMEHLDSPDRKKFN